MATPMLISLALFSLFLTKGVLSTTFTFENKCAYTVWPGILGGNGQLESTGFELQHGASRTLSAPAKWSGRMWPRRNCTADGAGKFSCTTGDCGTGRVTCDGLGGAPPATLVEFTLNGADGKDFFDVSLVDGFNVPVSLVPQGVQGCNSTACPRDVNGVCPSGLQIRGADGAVAGCQSACAALKSDRYCCAGAFNDPKKCTPTEYSMIFKKECPQAYSYAYDDATSTFTCIGANYLITFCP